MTHRDRRRSFRPRCETLDDRILLSASPDVFIQDQVLFVVGTDGDDVIDVTIRPFRAGHRQIPVVRVDGVPRWFPATRFQMVAVNAGAGDDIVRIDDRGLPLLPVWIDGGEGNDTLVGGSGDNIIMGGPGDDVIESRGTSNVIDAGPGRNIINGVPDRPAPTTPDDAPVAPVPGFPDDARDPGPPAPIAPPPPAPVSTVVLTADERTIVDLTNQARAEVGLGSLVVNGRLQQAAQIHAANMVRLNRIAHELPETETPTLMDRARAVGYRYATLAENLAFNYFSPSQAVEGWLDSEGHRRNILDPDVTEIGVAIARNTFGQAYFVQVFGRPMA